MSGPTVVDRKLAFLRWQKQILTKGIPPSNNLRRIAEEGGVPPKVLGDVMNKVNRDVRRHGREVYSTQMTEHVAEEIDLLYYEAATPALDAEADVAADNEVEDSERLYVADDLTLHANISKLPLAWDTSADAPFRIGHGDQTVDQDAYRDAVARLQDLSERRLALQQKLNAVRTLKSLLEPLRDPQKNIQPNLVTQDGPLASELSKTKALAARVAGRVGEKYGDVQVPATAEESDEGLFEEDGNTRLGKILDSW